MNAWGRITKWFDQHPLWIVVSVLVSFSGLDTFLESVGNFRAPLTEFILAGLKVDYRRHAVGLKGWFFILICLLALGATLLFIFWLRAFLQKNRYRSMLTQQGSATAKTLQGMVRAASRIREQLFPGQAPRVHMVRLHNTYLIDQHFNGEVTRVYEFKALAEPVHFWQIWMSVEEAADPVALLDEINFKIRDGQGQQVTYLPSLISDRQKKVMIFFLPRLEATESESRKITVTYKWPRMFGKLAKDGVEDQGWTLTSAMPVCEACFEVYLEPGTGRNLSCRIAGKRIGEDKESLASITHPEKHWPGFKYELHDAAAGDYCLEFKLKQP